MNILTHKNEPYPINTENYQGILTLSTIANGYLFKRRYQFYSEKEALKDFKRELLKELNK